MPPGSGLLETPHLLSLFVACCSSDLRAAYTDFVRPLPVSVGHFLYAGLPTTCRQVFASDGAWTRPITNTKKKTKMGQKKKKNYVVPRRQAAGRQAGRLQAAAAE